MGEFLDPTEDDSVLNFEFADDKVLRCLVVHELGVLEWLW